MKAFNQYITEKIKLSGDRFENQHNGFEYVDLELPSGNLWAVTNVGADKETDFGDYFAWGEIKPKEVYTWKTYKWCEQKYSKLTKYCMDAAFGGGDFTDDITHLEPEDDVANVLMKGKWHIPSDKDVEELMNNTTGSWESNYNGTSISGLVLTGKNKKQLFLPAVGYKDNDNTFNVDFAGYYWISELNTNASSDNCETFVVRKNKNELFVTTDERYYGNCIRPVLKK